jgi:hypothetical protein
MVAEEANVLAGSSWEGSLSWAAGPPRPPGWYGASVSGYVKGCVGSFCSVLSDGMLRFFEIPEARKDEAMWREVHTVLRYLKERRLNAQPFLARRALLLISVINISFPYLSFSHCEIYIFST